VSSSSYIDISSFLIVAHYLIIVGFTLRVISVRRPVGTSLAWLAVIFILPFAGAVVYMLFGERRVGKVRTQRSQALAADYRRWLEQLANSKKLAPTGLTPVAAAISRLAVSTSLFPVLAGNGLQVFDRANKTFDAIVADIDNAKSYCHLEYYIWNEAGEIDTVSEALIRAKKRGVVVRLLVDAVGSKPFLKGQQCKRLKAAGIEIQAALPINLLRMIYRRMDLRTHRKIVVIDQKIAYTGSLNMVDPRFFKQEAGVGQWVDAMVRVEGPAALALDVLFRWDWEVETGKHIGVIPDYPFGVERSLPAGANVQLIPSGPGFKNETISELVISSIYAARHKLVITTPYFVPDEPLMIALKSCALRGVDVSLIVPEKVDSRMVRFASHGYYEDLLRAGIKIFHFRGGLLHTKSMTADDEFTMIGTVNLDIRSLLLNFEVSLFVYDELFSGQILALQNSYLRDSVEVDLETWGARPIWYRLIENSAHLISPLL